MKRLLFATLVLACGTGSAGAVNLVKSYSHFTVTGRTFEQIQKQLSTRGPEVKTTGSRHPGATQMAFTTRIGYAETGTSCRIASATVTVKTKVILPVWRPRGKVDPDLKLGF